MTQNNNSNSLIANRKIFLFDVIDADSVKHPVEKIIALNEYDDQEEKKIIDYKRRPIEIVLNSPGGNAFDGYALVSAIELSKTPVHTLSLGHCMSMALPMFAVSHRRIAHKYTTFMYHEIAWGRYDKATAVQEVLNEAYRLQDMYDKTIVERTKIPMSKLQQVRKEKENWYMSAEEAHKLGLVDVLL